VDIVQLSKRSEALQTETEKVFRHTFPDARKMNNLRVRMERDLEKLYKTKGQSTGGFLDLLG